jgi:acyl phosphate:glycerol-3-phosphate acyltransferase
MFTVVVPLIIVAMLAYLWGSLPSGYWMGKFLRGRNFDIRQHGSHKIGATNVQRTLGTVPAIIVFLLDISKGIGPALLATYVPCFYGNGWGILVAGLAALLGHCFSIFIGFKGGRGVLTATGVLLIASPLIFVIGTTTTLCTIGISRYVSLGSVVGAMATMACSMIFYTIGLAHPDFFGRISLPQMLYLVVAPVLVIIFHADNIGRLLKGTERRFGRVSIEPNTKSIS